MLTARARPRPGCLHTRPLALVPEPEGALLGAVPKGSPEFQRIAGEAARTIPGCSSPVGSLILLSRRLPARLSGARPSQDLGRHESQLSQEREC